MKTTTILRPYWLKYQWSAGHHHAVDYNTVKTTIQLNAMTYARHTYYFNVICASYPSNVYEGRPILP